MAMGAVWLATGLLEPHTPNAEQPLNEIGFIQMIVWAVLLFGWVKAHARANGITPPTGASILAALFPPVGVPYYAFRAFGARAGAKLTGWAVLTLVVLFVLYALAYELSAGFGA
jgi:hypothetical protein